MKKISSISSAVLMTAMMLSSCGGGASKEVTIGKQVWMSENLNVDKFRNGDPIPHAKTDEEWEKAGENGEPAWCYYNNNPDNGDRYGKLYNWYAVNDPRGLAPEGWHIPTDAEWSLLSNYLNGDEVAGQKMKSTRGWEQEGNGTNDSGFTGLPGGYRSERGTFGITFSGVGRYGYWWSSTKNGIFSPSYWNLDYDDMDLDDGREGMGEGFSVRCIKN